MKIRSGLALSALVLVAVSCPKGEEPTTVTSSPSVAPTSSAPVSGIPQVEPGGQPTAEAAIAALCVPPEPFGEDPIEPGPLSPELAEVAAQVEQVRGAEFPHPVAVEAITDEVMDAKLEEAFEAAYPEEFYERRTAAWRTMGAIPPDADLREAYRTYLVGQVVGFYNPTDGELVYLGEGDLGLVERMVLAHELTHALDDQRFNLKRLDGLAARCLDEDYSAALGLVEGSAQYYASEVLIEFPQMDLTDLADALTQALGEGQGLESVPQLVQELQSWPYTAGQSFVTALTLEGGDAAVDGALRDLPVSTEQILHPAKYPTDTPTEVDVPDLTPELGPQWGDLDAMQVGEAWLRAFLALRLPNLESDEAAAGWDGGVYRAWTDGHDIVVVMRTAWDSEAEAQGFATALAAWAADGSPVEVDQEGDMVTAVFSTDQAFLGVASS